MRRRVSALLAIGAVGVGMAFGPVSGAWAVSGNSPKSPGNSTHFSNTGTPCTVSGNHQCPSPSQQ
jgi:hypothetical protein